jgi:predicted porin
MKKTIIAAAVAAAVAAPAAFADVSISGNVNMELQDKDATTGWGNSTNTDLVFKASEDLGNGMKAGMKYHLFNDDGGNSVADTTVNLSGDFGSINAGRQESMNMAYFHGFAAGDAAHDMTLEDSNGQQARSNAVIYTSPSMNGLTVAAGFSAGGQVLANGAADATETDDIDGTDLMVKYTNGGLTVALGRTEQKGTAADAEITNIAASYKMGDLKVAVLNRDVENGRKAAAGDSTTAGTNELTTVSLTYTMGANTIYAGITDSDDAQDGDTVVTLNHAMSKRTSVYVGFKDDDSAGDTNTLVGIKHSF